MEKLPEQGTQERQPVGVPPPPPPPVAIPSLKLDPTTKWLMELRPNTNKTAADELLDSSKIKIGGECIHEGVGDPKEPKPVDKQASSECPICNKWCLKYDMPMHKQSHGSKVLDYLYVGGFDCASNIKELSERVRCSYVLNCASECTNSFPERFVYKKLDLQDNLKQDITAEFEASFEFIEKAKNDRKVVLVHCQQGRSRSVTIVLAYLMKHNQMTLRQAYEHTKACRPETSPNPNYIHRLKQYELQLYGKNSMLGHEILPVYRFLYKSEYSNGPKE